MLTRDDGLLPTSTVRNNNHRYWAGFAVASVAVATADQRLWNWGLESYRIGICAVDEAGALPLELRRGEAARAYHVYALGPLLGTAELAARNGVPAYEVCGGKLHRLVRFVMESIDDPAAIERFAKTPQGPFFRDDGTIRAKNSIAGMEFYERRFPNRTSFSARFRQQRPYAATELGGAVTRQLDLAGSR